MAETEPTKPEVNADVEAAKSRASDLQKELDRVTKKLQTKLDAEAEATKAALAEQGKFKELYEQSEAKFKAESEPIKAELERFRTIEKAEKEALIQKLPEDQREKWSRADVELIRDHVASLTAKSPLPGNRPGVSDTDKPWEELSVLEQEDIQAKDYPKYVRLYNEYQRRRGVKIFLK